jgi:predicted MFS family arabinose efflux permease
MGYNSDGEIYGWKALNFALIGLSVVIMLGVLWQLAAPDHAVANKPAVQVETVVVEAPAPPAAG